ncbi:NHL repeat-containing protein [Acrasis kona]|uniref:NHL repeat-containing protein n=1 Tax=Acrasis kona TaxID=1008807 RepID=A0AAW2ZBR2_9EUKA
MEVSIFAIMLYCLVTVVGAYSISTFVGEQYQEFRNGIKPTSLIIFPTDLAIDGINNICYFASLGRLFELNVTSGTVTDSSYDNMFDGVKGAVMKFKDGQGVVIDDINNLIYFADGPNNLVRVVNRTSGMISTFAGTGESGDNGDNIIATNASLYYPTGVAVDNINNLVYITDTGNHRIRVANRTSGLISTFAGTGGLWYNGDNIIATSASLFNPIGLAVDSINNLVYIADSGYHRIRVVNRTSGLISTFAGTGDYGYNGDYITATSALLYIPTGVAVDSINDLVYIADSSNNRIRVVDRRNGNISTFAGTSGVDGTNNNRASIVPLNRPIRVSIDNINNLVYIADAGNSVIRVVDRSNNKIKSIVGTGYPRYCCDNEPYTYAVLKYPESTAVDSINNLVYIADSGNHRIRVANRTSGLISTFAGTGDYGYNGDYITATSALLYRPTGVAVDSINDLVYIADSSNNRFRVVDRTSGLINTVAGSGVNGYNGDNITATNALLYRPTGVAVDSINNLVYIADSGNHRIRVVNRTSGLISTFAGTGDYGYNGDYITATNALLYIPTGVAVDSINDLVYIADSSNNRFRVVDRTSGLINTVAGVNGYNGDNLAATNAMLSRTSGVSIDNINDLIYIADTENHLIRSVPLSNKVVAPDCFNVSSTNPSVCSGNGNCVSYNNCVCKKNSYIGEQCENDVTKSAYFFAFNRDTFNKSFINDGTGPYTVSDDGIDIEIFESQKDFTFQASFNPLFDLPGSQFFLAFKLSDLLSSALSFRFGLEPYPYSNGRFFSSKIQFDETAQNMVFESYDQVSSALKIKASTNYILYISFNKNMTQVTSHITDQKGTILVNNILFLSDRDFVNELLKSKYRVWFGLFQYKTRAERGVKVKAMYYGVSTGSVNNKLANTETQNNGSANNAPNVCMIIGIIIVSSIGYLLML